VVAATRGLLSENAAILLFFIALGRSDTPPDLLPGKLDHFKIEEVALPMAFEMTTTYESRDCRWSRLPMLLAEPCPAFSVHHSLLEDVAPIFVLENIDRRDVPAADCGLFCLPLKVHGGDGAPARTLLETMPGAHQ
jgi:kynurenine formamidase